MSEFENLLNQSAFSQSSNNQYTLDLSISDYFNLNGFELKDYASSFIDPILQTEILPLKLEVFPDFFQGYISADAGSYQGELGIFSLEGMENLAPGSTEFIQEAARRVLSNSQLGSVVISDENQGSRFSGELEEGDQNQGDYLGVESFTFNEGDEIEFIFAPNGTIEEVFNNPDVEGNVRPLFSLPEANPNGAIHLGQLLAESADRTILGWEDLRVDQGSDLDYNDLIFHVTGAVGSETNLADLIAQDRNSPPRRRS